MDGDMSDRREDLVLGASHADKIGMVIVVDVEGKDGREIFTGTLTSARDKYKENGDVERTTLVVGGQTVTLGWNGDETLTALIEIP